MPSMSQSDFLFRIHVHGTSQSMHCECEPANHVTATRATTRSAPLYSMKLEGSVVKCVIR